MKHLLPALCLIIAAATTHAADGLRVAWTNNILSLESPRLPGGRLQIWYLEAFLRSGANGREWGQSVLKHRTKLVEAAADKLSLKFVTTVATNVTVHHSVHAREDELELVYQLTNAGPTAVDLQWFLPACIRVAEFTGRNQTNFIERTFLYTQAGLTTLDRLRRTTNALYLGGQVYPMPGVPETEANPRPVSPDRPIKGLIGCFSADDRWILATASDRTHELFEGVYVCFHSDPALGGLAPGESKTVRQKVYLVPNDPAALLRRYERDFPAASDGRR